MVWAGLGVAKGKGTSGEGVRTLRLAWGLHFDRARGPGADGSDQVRLVGSLSARVQVALESRADFLLALADFDRGRGWAALGHPSLWAFLHHDLGLSTGAAFQRKEAVALLRELPAVEAPLRDGRLCLSSVAAVASVAKVLKPERQAEWLPRFFGLSAREARALAAELVPAEVVPARVVVTPVAPKVVVKAAQGPSDGGETGGTFLTCETEKTQPGRGATPTSTSTSVEDLPLLSGERVGVRGPPSQRAEAVPLTAELSRLHLTVLRRFLQKLEALRAARSHASPGASVEALLEEAMDQLLEKEAKRREAVTDRPVAAPRPAAPGTVPAQVRREVWARDLGCCRWPLEAGGMCGSTWRLELDHVRPRARGGPSTAANLRLLCRAHNAEAARRAYGAEFMERAGRRGAGSPPGPSRGACEACPEGGPRLNPP